MNRHRRLLGAGLALLAATGRAATFSLATQDARAVRAVVEAQLQAMATGDAERAFSYAAPAIQTQFGDAQRFMAMVAGSYPMVIRPAGTVFFQPTLDTDGDVLQVVQELVDADLVKQRLKLIAVALGTRWQSCVEKLPR
jgi:hypothetical protein